MKNDLLFLDFFVDLFFVNFMRPDFFSNLIKF